MKKRTLSLLLALVMCLSLLPMTALAALEANYRLRWNMGSTQNNPAYVEWHVATQSLQVTYTRSSNFFQLRDADNPDTEQKSKLYIKDGENWNEIPGVTSKIVGVDGIRSGTWRSAMYKDVEGYTGSPTYQTVYLQFFKDGQVFTFDGGVDYGVYFEIYTDGYPHGSMPDDIFGFGNPATSGWALPEIGQADELGLIPDVLQGADLTKPITRAEFAAVAVKLYEYMAETTAAPSATNPFTDTKDAEVLKALGLGLVDGITPMTFEPDALLTREQAATLLTRVYKKITMPGWSIGGDSGLPLSFTMPAKFIDDAYISGYARESVYYMAANGILQGDNGRFSPNYSVPGYEAIGGAQRQHAIIISLRMAENLGK